MEEKTEIIEGVKECRIVLKSGHKEKAWFFGDSLLKSETPDNIFYTFKKIDGSMLTVSFIACDIFEISPEFKLKKTIKSPLLTELRVVQ